MKTTPLIFAFFIIPVVMLFGFVLGNSAEKSKKIPPPNIIILLLERIERKSWNYSFNLNTAFNLGNNLDVLFNLNYLSRIVTIQGEKSRFFSPNLTIRKSLMGERLTSKGRSL